jgi:hypothetical protein
LDSLIGRFLDGVSGLWGRLLFGAGWKNDLSVYLSDWIRKEISTCVGLVAFFRLPAPAGVGKISVVVSLKVKEIGQ